MLQDQLHVFCCPFFRTLSEVSSKRVGWDANLPKGSRLACIAYGFIGKRGKKAAPHSPRGAHSSLFSTLE